MSATIQLHRVNIEDVETQKYLSDILQPLLPYSLPILGCLYCRDIDSPTTSKLHAWTTFPLDRHLDPPALFSVLIYPLFSDCQSRFFCSGEMLQVPPTEEEKDHVRNVLSTFITALKTGDPVVEGVNYKSALSHQGGTSLLVGSLNDRWNSCIRTLKNNPPGLPLTMKFVYKCDRREEETTSWNKGDEEWEYTELREEDLRFVSSKAHFPRSVEFLKGRIPYSVCVRRKGDLVEDNKTPVAWEMLYSDGSSGLLHVEPEYRGSGMGRRCMEALSAKMAERYNCKDEQMMGKYPYTRWEMRDVSVNNPVGMYLAATRPASWKQTWLIHWVYLTIPHP